MRMKMMLIVSVVLLSLPGVLWSMETSAPSDAAYARLRGRTSTTRPDNPAELRIYALRYYPACEMVNILAALTSSREVRIVQDDRGNRIIVTAPPECLQEIKELIEVMDVPPATGPQARQMMWRVYMLELPPKDQHLKPFSLVIESDEQLLATQFLNATTDASFQISSFRQGDELAPSDNVVFTIQGRAASNQAIGHMLEQIPNALMSELRWEDDTFTTTVPAAQVTQLPASLQEHVRKFLGAEVQTVGYWFGNLSIPGEIRAPIGAWRFELNVETEQSDELRLGVRVEQESQIDAETWRTQEIFSNSVRGRVGKPVIIGYNRDRYGTRTMGAMVIVPEMDTAPAGAAPETKSP